MIKPTLSKDWQNKIDLFTLDNKKIVYTQMIDSSIFWVHNLTQKKELVYLTNDYTVYYCYEHDFYIVYLIKIAGGHDLLNIIKNDLHKLIEKNYVHYILNDSTFAHRTKDILQDLANSDNFDYSLLMICSEIATDKNPFEIEKFKKIKYFFSCTNIVSENKNTEYSWVIQNLEKIKIDYKYSLIYFYYKFGFCYYQKGKQELEISNRKNQVFLYSKHSGEHTERYKSIQQALDTNRICEKSYTSDNWFWYFANYNYYHMPFFTDYNNCKFNLVMETQPMGAIKDNSNLFVSEKTLKGLMVSTPAYIALQYQVYQNLKETGFYFLNEEFGEYDENTYIQNYHNFCNWLKNCSDSDFDEMFEKTYKKSINNKVILEDFFDSDKTKEINLLINR